MTPGVSSMEPDATTATDKGTLCSTVDVSLWGNATASKHGFTVDCDTLSSEAAEPPTTGKLALVNVAANVTLEPAAKEPTAGSSAIHTGNRAAAGSDQETGVSDGFEIVQNTSCEAGRTNVALNDGSEKVSNEEGTFTAPTIENAFGASGTSFRESCTV